MTRWTFAILLISVWPGAGLAQNIITTVAGSGISGYSGDGGAATQAELSVPSSVAVDSAGNIYIADQRNNRVRKVAASGVITTLAGNGNPGYAGDGGPATSAELNSPNSVAVDGAGDVYIADTLNNRIRIVQNGTIFTAVGNGTAGYAGDGGPAGFAELFYPYGIALDTSGNLYIADTLNARIRMVSPVSGGTLALGTINTIAGTGVAGYSGDDGLATSAQIYHPDAVAVDPNSGIVYIADTLNSRVRIIFGGNIGTVAGNGFYGSSGDGGPATSAEISYPYGLAIDSSGNVYIADAGNEKIRLLNGAGNISTYAGNGTAAYSGDGGPPANAGLTDPTGVAVNAAGNLYIADNADSRIRLVAPAAAPLGPSIRAGGVISASGFGGFAAIAPGSWVEIYGSNLAADSRPWNASDFNGLMAPTSLDGTSVTIGGVAAYVSYISSGQVNVVAPSNLPVGPQPVVVTTPAGSSAAYTITVNATEPGLYAPYSAGGNQYAAATVSGAGYAMPTGAVPGVQSAPAHAGETITLYGTGFGPVTGVYNAGAITQFANSLTLPVQVSIGGAPAPVSYAGSAPASVGLYQFNVTVPEGVSGSAVPLTFTLNGAAGTQTLYIAVQ